MNILNDGVDHINIYSKAKSALGRSLSNFAYSPIDSDTYGRFNSVEAFWYFLRVVEILEQIVRTEDGRNNNARLIDQTQESLLRLRQLSGYKAKVFGRELLDTLPASEDKEPSQRFKELILKATAIKILRNPLLRQELINSGDLPLKHYYWFGNDPKTARIVEPKEHFWLIEFITKLRELLLDGSHHSQQILNLYCLGVFEN